MVPHTCTVWADRFCPVSPCQTLDLNVSSSEPMDHVTAAQAAADPPLPWVTRMLPYAEAMRRDPNGKHPLPDTGISTSTITLGCSNAQGDKCVPDAFLKDVLLDLFGPQVPWQFVMHITRLYPSRMAVVRALLL